MQKRFQHNKNAEAGLYRTATKVCVYNKDGFTIQTLAKGTLCDVAGRSNNGHYFRIKDLCIVLIIRGCRYSYEAKRRLLQIILFFKCRYGIAVVPHPRKAYFKRTQTIPKYKAGERLTYVKTGQVVAVSRALDSNQYEIIIEHSGDTLRAFWNELTKIEQEKAPYIDLTSCKTCTISDAPYFYFPIGAFSFLPKSPDEMMVFMKAMNAKDRQWSILAHQKLSAVAFGTKKVDDNLVLFFAQKINAERKYIWKTNRNFYDPILVDPTLINGTSEVKEIYYKALFDSIGTDPRPLDFLHAANVERIEKKFDGYVIKEQKEKKESQNWRKSMTKQFEDLRKEVQQNKLDINKNHQPDPQPRRGFNILQPWFG